jgi:multidrug efflux pump subunit AcrB
METGKINHVVLSSLLVILFFSSLSILLANSNFIDDKKYEQVAIELTQKLSSKVNLTSNQTGKIKNILVNYQKEVLGLTSNEDKTSMEEKTDENRSAAKADPVENANEEIQSILNDDQKTAYMEFKDEWWKEVTQRVELLKTDSKIDKNY